MTEKALTTTEGGAVVAAGDFASITSMAEAFAKSGMFEGIKGAAQAVVKIMAGRELGLPPVYSMQNLHMVKGRLTTSAQTIGLLIKSSGKYDYKVVESTDKQCVVDFYQKAGDKWEKIGTQTWTMEDARRADLLKPDSGWTKYPVAMLFSRCLSAGGRKFCPDAIGGVYTREEIESSPDIGDVSSLEVVEAEKPTDSPYWCQKHQALWFKKGKMKAYAHPIAGTNPTEWCEMPTMDESEAIEESQPAPASTSPVNARDWNDTMVMAASKGLDGDSIINGLKKYYNIDVCRTADGKPDFVTPPPTMTADQLADFRQRIEKARPRA